MKRVVLTVTNDVFTDQRVNKMAQTLKDMGFDPLIIGVIRNGSLPFSPPWATVKRIPLIFQKGFLFYAGFNLKLFVVLLFAKADLIIANDLDTLLAAHLAAKIRRKPLIYDTHEYFTGSPEVAGRPFRLWFWSSLENILFPKQDTIITVNQSIAQAYEKKFRKSLLVVRNMPRYRLPDLSRTRKDLGLPEAKHIILLQGSGINTDRGTEELIYAMRPEYGIDNALLLIIGGGNVTERIKKQVTLENLNDRVWFLPKMHYENLIQYTSHATIGVSLDKPTSLNYLLSLPNKLFDYIMAGTPVLASNLPEVRHVVEKYKVGKIAQNHNPAHFAQCIKEMLADSEQLRSWHLNCLKAAKELNWETEEQTIRSIFHKFL